MRAPLALYPGRTLHRRTNPFEHAFRYKIAFIQICIDRLDEAASVSRWFSVNAFNLYGFYPRDHGDKGQTPLGIWARKQFREAGLNLPETARIELLCQPRVMGYQFNPISVYLAYDSDETLLGALYEVHNTFGDAHIYAAPFANADQFDHVSDKRFHVSPFFDVSGNYHFALRQNVDRIALRIEKQGKAGPDFLASMILNRIDASDRAFRALFMSQPFSTLKTISAIHWEALKIWIKGGRYHPRPQPPKVPVTITRLGAKAISS